MNGLFNLFLLSWNEFLNFNVNKKIFNKKELLIKFIYSFNIFKDIIFIRNLIE